MWHIVLYVVFISLKEQDDEGEDDKNVNDDDNSDKCTRHISMILTLTAITVVHSPSHESEWK